MNTGGRFVEGMFRLLAGFPLSADPPMRADVNVEASGEFAASIPTIGAADAPLSVRAFYEAGDPGPIVATLAHVPELLEVAAPFLGVVFGPSCVPARAKEIVVLRTSARAGCRFCVEAHTVVALEAGLSDEEVRSLRGDLPVELVFTDRAEMALVAWVDVVGSFAAVHAADRSALRSVYPDHQVVELTLLLGVTLMLNRFCTALDLPTDAAVAATLDAGALRWLR